ncbi:MAG: YidC/Oxa1 family membrane protein insertase, partial [Acutalibacteraceae bacterium]|nr:YidC/Oxa1 family membrane protein insertase [Acutalibacteraceae bacterium]
MNSIFDIIGVPFQYVLNFFHMFTGGTYALAILVFTIAVNAAMIPLTVKQQKSMAKQARLRPKLDALQKKYGDDRVKMANAQQELYQNENISPTGGCLPMFIRMLVLMGVYRAVYRIIETGTSVNFNLFGLDLSQTPNFTAGWQPIWIIPILSFVASVLSMLVSQLQQRKINPQAASGGGAMIGMMLFMPLFSLYIAFNVQGAVGYYWIISNIVGTGIQLIVNSMYSANKILAKNTLDEGLKRRQY